ncbi:hypothetical protein EV356DRAFT_530209 [Viridothelium virens]|uniref:Vacuolar protein sorting-associated protein 51 homolog n=1 Tax=Viridothelium virens TaxID=1048519 RepID=A0A6A6HHY2_VIRVR|nr:hypothetical protein EV356DRAFT_530209 [Viridothelium virens]
MSTLVSPRPSTQISSSRRTSLESSTATSRSASATRPPQASETLRRNRAALRDYYGLKGPQTEAESKAIPPVEVELESELDKAGFNAEQYVKDVLARERLEGILKTESNLVSEIRGLDGERKSLVYDNYSKLISATDTIRRMRTSMDPLTPTASTLSPAIAHIAETAEVLSRNLAEKTRGVRREAEESGRERSGSRGKEDENEGKKRARETVRWVVDAPGRMRGLIVRGKRGDAEKEWEQVRGLLEKWDGVKEVEEVRKQCEDVLKEADAG